MSAEDRPPEEERPLSADIGRLLLALAFFGGCVILIVAAKAIGLYH